MPERKHKRGRIWQSVVGVQAVGVQALACAGWDELVFLMMLIRWEPRAFAAYASVGCEPVLLTMLIRWERRLKPELQHVVNGSFYVRVPTSLAPSTAWLPRPKNRAGSYQNSRISGGPITGPACGGRTSCFAMRPLPPRAIRLMRKGDSKLDGFPACYTSSGQKCDVSPKPRVRLRRSDGPDKARRARFFSPLTRSSHFS